MAADPITPARAAAFSNSVPEITGVASRIVCQLRLQTNLSAFTPIDGSPQGINLFPIGGLTPILALVSAQNTASENGIYTLSYVGGASVTATGTFDGSGNYIKTGLTASRYYYVRIVNPGEQCTNGSDILTQSGAIAASAGGTLTFKNGASGATNANLLNEAKWVRATQFDTANEFPDGMKVFVELGTDAGTTWALTYSVAAVGASAIVFTKNNATAVSSFTGSPSFDNTGPTAITPGRAASFDNTAPSTISVPTFH